LGAPTRLIFGGRGRICGAYLERRPYPWARRASVVARELPSVGEPPPLPGEGTDRR
jgi:hypothetical protein